MKTYLVDTTILIDHLRGDKGATKYLLEISGKMVVAGSSVGELLQGVKSKQELSIVNRVIKDLEIEWCTPQVEKWAHGILEKYHLKTGVGFLDCIIAAHALKNNWQLVTRNTKHFRQIDNLMVTDPKY
jgi:tRNA(fMet)-specific endonuclease VapC